ncbi:PLxRFG domain-containing protein [Comamonas aquatica]|nr:PLxRFG domain-containing protein [Comamonas aquatica]
MAKPSGTPKVYTDAELGFAPQAPSFGRSVGDSAIALGTGVAQGVKMVSDAFGADNAVSRLMGKGIQAAEGLESDYRKAEKQARARKIKEAEDSGSTWEEVKAYAGSFADAPLDTTLNAVGSVVPTLAAATLTGGGSAAAQLAARAAPMAIGAVQGAGAVKGGIYEAVEQRHLEAGATPEQAAARASAAQAYDGDNLGSIATGAGLGVLAGSTGAEAAVRRLASVGAAKQLADASAVGIAKGAAVGAAKEAPIEAVQGGQERLAANLAEQSEGFDTPTMRGVLGQAALEGMAAAPLGGGLGAAEASGRAGRADHAAARQNAEAAAQDAQAKTDAKLAADTMVADAQLQAQERARVLAEQEVGTPEVPQTTPPDGAAALRAQQEAAAAARQQELEASRAVQEPDDEILQSTGQAEPVRPSEAMGLRADAGVLESAAAMAVDSGLTQQLQAEATAQQYIDPADDPSAGMDWQSPAMSSTGQEINYDDLSPLEKDLYDWEMTQQNAPDEAFASLVSLDDSDIPFFDQASNVSDEDFCAPWAHPTRKSPMPLQLPTNPEARKAVLQALLKLKQMTPEARARVLGQSTGQVTQPAQDIGARIAQLDAEADAADAEARDWASRTYKANGKDLPKYAAQGGPADVGEANEQRRLKAIADAKGRAAAARTEAQALRDQGNADAAAASKTTSNQGAKKNGTQTPQTQQASTQQPAAGAAAGQAVNGVPAATAAQAAGPAAKQGAVNGGTTTGNNGAQASQQGAAGSQEAVATIAQEGNARREAERARKLEASERWTLMDADARKAAAAKAQGLNAIAKKNVHTKPWADLSEKVRAALLDAVAPVEVAPQADEFGSTEYWQGLVDKTKKPVEKKKTAAKIKAASAADAKDSGVNQSEIIDGVEKVATQSVSVVGKDIDAEWAEFSKESGSKGIPRAQMPQIKAVHRGAMTNFMNARGVKHEEQEVAADTLKPTQAEFSKEKVARAKDAPPTDRSVLVSKDGYVLDGHHQWMAALEKGEQVKVIRLDAEIDQLLTLAHEFPSSTVAEGSPKTSQEQSGQALAAIKSEPVPAPKATAAPRIDDVGEKIGGARKDLWAEFKDDLRAVPDDQIQAQPLSKIWPQTDYQKLIEAGHDPAVVALVRSMRDAVPVKPRQSHKVKRWAEQVQLLRSLAMEMLDGKLAQQKLREQLRVMGSRDVLGVLGRAELYEAMGHSKSLEGITFGEHQYSLYRGRENVNLWVVEQAAKATAFSNWPREIATGDTKEAALQAFKQAYGQLGEVQQKKTASFDIISETYTRNYYVGKKLGRNYAKLAGPFKTVKEARAHRDANEEGLTKQLQAYKLVPQERADENRPRVGQDMRNGVDVTPEQFRDTFGFRGVEFGNWVEQGKRQQELNDAYDALMDLAAVLQLPSKAMSLNGELGMAFGARGTGGVGAFKAHYEPGKVVINLTKRSGAGSLGHEWWHAVDNYFSRMRKSADGFMTSSRDVLQQAKGSQVAPSGEGVRLEMVQAFGGVMRAINSTALRDRSVKLDERRSKDYWSTDVELSARAFEGYLLAKLQDQDASNDYLVNVVSPKVWETAAQAGVKLDDAYPYPSIEEMPVIRAGFDRLFEVMESKETDKGVALFRASGVFAASQEAGTAGLSLEQAQKAVKEALAGLGSAPPVNVVGRSAELGISAPDGVMGAMIPSEGRIVLVASAHTSDLEVVETLFHEMFHLGLRNVLPSSDYVQVMLDLAKRDARVQRYAIDWKKNAPDAPLQLQALRERGYVGSELTAQYEALAIEEGLAVVAQELAARKLPGTALTLRVRQLAGWFAGVAQRMGMSRLAASIRKLTYNDAERFVMTAIDAAGRGTDARASMDAMYRTQGSGELSEGSAMRGLDLAQAMKVLEQSQTGMSAQMIAQVNKVVDGIRKTWVNAPEVVVAYGMEDAKIPKEALATDSLQRSEGAEGDPEGFYWEGKVYLLADMLHTPNDVARVFFHEALGHHGLRGVFGKQLDGVLEQITVMRKADVAAKLTQYGLQNTPKGRRVAAEEVLAEMAQTTPEIGFVKRALAAVRTWLRANVPGFKSLQLSDAEIIRDYILPARAWVERGGPDGNGPRGGQRIEPAMSRAEATSATDSDNILFSRSKMAELKNKGLQMAHTYMSHPGKVSLWDKTVGTMRHVAERYPAFKPVFEAAQQFIDDVASVANQAAQYAPRLIPRVETLSDLRKKPISVVDNRAIGKALFGGTLDWGRDQHGKAMPIDELKAKYAGLTVDQKAEVLLAAKKVDPRVMAMWRGKQLEQFEALINSKFDSSIIKAGVAFNHKELRDFFGMNEQQISLYDEARATVDKSLDITARAEMLRALGRDWDGFRDMVMDAPTLTDAWKLLDDELEQRAKAIPDSRDQMAAKMFQIRASHDKARELMDSGYMPLQRFGKYTVDVVGADGERIYFGMFESKADSNRMAETMKREYQGASVTQGTLNDQQYKLFAGITPETAELFGTMLGLDAAGNDAKDQAFQEFLKLSKNNHSALKRLIHRKGIAGYSEDVGRVLASFVYSNARLAATGLNAGKMETAINDLNTKHKHEGELGEIAAKLREYIQDPQEEGQAIRGMLFAQYLGGSIASAMVNMTQPFAVTLPWLSQFGGMAKASRYLTGALKDMATRGFKYDSELAHALKMAEDDGVVSPQEIHQLMAQARGAGGLRTGDGTKTGDARANAANVWEKVKVGWGQPFALAEQFNRRSTFIAAYRLAKEQGKDNPAEFARRAVVETQFLYTKANKPQWARGAVGGTLFTFKTYSVSFLELMQRTWNAGEAGSPERAAGRRAVGWAMLMLMLMGGAGGLPFVEDVEDLVDSAGQMMGYNTSVKQWRQQAMRDVLGAELANFLESGLSGLPGMPLDVSGRLGMGNLIPGTGLLLDKQSNARDVVELLGPAGDLVQRGLEGTKEIIKGAINADGAQMARGAGQWAPNAVRNLAKGTDMAVSGMYKDSKGYKVIDTTLDEAILKAIGFQPRSVAEVQEGNSFMQRSKSFYIQTSSDIKAKWAQALFEKDAAGVERARERVQEWNRKNPDQPIRINMPDIWKRVAQMGKDRTDRIADTAPKALRQQLRSMAQEQSR